MYMIEIIEILYNRYLYRYEHQSKFESSSSPPYIWYVPHLTCCLVVRSVSGKGTTLNIFNCQCVTQNSNVIVWLRRPVFCAAKCRQISPRVSFVVTHLAFPAFFNLIKVVTLHFWCSKDSWYKQVWTNFYNYYPELIFFKIKKVNFNFIKWIKWL